MEITDKKFYYGMDFIQNRKILIDKKKLISNHSLIFGTTGSGKTTFVKKEINQIQQYCPMDNIVVFDTDQYGMYDEFKNKESIIISESEYINPLALIIIENCNGNIFCNYDDFIINLFSIITQTKLSSIEIKILKSCSHSICSEFVKTQDYNKLPTLQDLFECIKNRTIEYESFFNKLEELYLDFKTLEKFTNDLEFEKEILKSYKKFLYFSDNILNMEHSSNWDKIINNIKITKNNKTYIVNCKIARNYLDKRDSEIGKLIAFTYIKYLSHQNYIKNEYTWLFFDDGLVFKKYFGLADFLISARKKNIIITSVEPLSFDISEINNYTKILENFSIVIFLGLTGYLLERLETLLKLFNVQSEIIDNYNCSNYFLLSDCTIPFTF